MLLHSWSIGCFCRFLFSLLSHLEEHTCIKTRYTSFWLHFDCILWDILKKTIVNCGKLGERSIPIQLWRHLKDLSNWRIKWFYIQENLQTISHLWCKEILVEKWYHVDIKFWIRVPVSFDWIIKQTKFRLRGIQIWFCIKCLPSPQR